MITNETMITDDTLTEGAVDLRQLFGADPALDHDLRDRIDRLVVSARAATAAASIPQHLLADRFAGRLPETGLPPRAYVDTFLNAVLDHALPVASPRSLANMSSVLPGAMPYLAALVTALNQNLVKSEASRALSLCETQVLAMLHRLVYPGAGRLPAEPVGVVTTGGTLANLTALWAARNTALDEGVEGCSVRRSGLAAALADRGLRGMAVVGPASMHYSFVKAADLLGLGSEGLIRVPLDGSGRIRLDELDGALRLCRRQRRLVLAVVGVAGSTDCGAVDPLPELADRAAAAGAAFHVDAAWGGPVLMSQRHRDLLDGIERADTVTLDGHKQLYAPVGIGLLLFRDPTRAAAIRHTADYALRQGSADLGRHSVEGSRPGSAMLLHAALHLLGRQGYEAAVDRTIALAAMLADRVRRRPEFELLLPPRLNLVLYRYLPPDLRGVQPADRTPAEQHRLDRLNEQVHKLQRAAGHALVSRTVWPTPPEGPGQPVLRAVLANPLTGPADLDAVLDEQVRLGDALGHPRSS
ncbi:aminotransferase class V-fold PLP-dependent enzyme [Microlunatus sp. GCM10028923]|uniref:aminotransferase class V-fold PLP-dependent enzyme n=1 Tax=Microlunatus sp. GCM10028923 TaxID=3273400 RepID=UPI00362051FE